MMNKTWEDIWKVLTSISTYQKKIDMAFINVLKSKTNEDANNKLILLKDLVDKGVN